MFILSRFASVKAGQLLWYGETRVPPKGDNRCEITEQSAQGRCLLNISRERGGDEMMVTEKQLAANRENAKKGGPKTAAGKDIVKLNALKHGLLAEYLILPGDDGKLLNVIWEKLLVELKPQGTLEEMAIACIVSNFWRRQMAMRLESDYLGEQFVMCVIAIEKKGSLEAWTNFVERELGRKNGWQNLIRYQTGFENKFYKAIHELERLQMARRGAAVPAPLAVDLDISKDV
jgi:hypothetical protein